METAYSRLRESAGLDARLLLGVSSSDRAIFFLLSKHISLEGPGYTTATKRQFSYHRIVL